MKSINTMKFVTEYSKHMAATLDRIENAESYEDAKKTANYAMGFVDGMTLFTNTMVCAENNDFIAEMGDVETDWRASICQAVANVAIRTHQPSDEVMHMLDRRDEYREYLK